MKEVGSLVFVTGNPRKLQEASEILAPIELSTETLDLPELQGSPDEIAREKARLAFKQLKVPLFVEDTSLHINAFGGLPGPYVKHFIQAIGTEGIVKMLSSFKDKSAVSRTTIAYCLDDGIISVVKGEVKGSIVEPRGTSNFGAFGFDPIFQPEGKNRTYAEMPSEEKNALSQRMKALKALHDALRKEVVP